MDTILELKDKRTLLIDKNKELMSEGDKEVRLLSDTELSEFNKNLNDIKTLDTEIRTAESVDEKELQIKEVKDVKIKDKNMSKIKTPLLRAIQNKVNNRPHDEALTELFKAGEAEMRSAGVNFASDIILPVEYRADILAGTTNAGEEVVSQDILNIMGPLMANMVLTKAGVRWVTGLVGDVAIPTYSGTTVAWKGEVVTADDGGGTFSEVTLAPKRLTAMVDVSKQFLLQDSAGAEALLKSNIVEALANKLEFTILGEHSTGATLPDGFWTGYSNTSNATLDGAATWAKIVGHETAISSSNALKGSLAYITNPAGAGILKTSAKGSSSDDIMLMGLDNTMNGYPVYVTSNVPAVTVDAANDEQGLVFGNWSDYIIGQWGGIELLVDPYTQAATGQIRILVNAYFDATEGRSASFSVASIEA